MPSRTFSNHVTVDALRDRVWAELQRPKTWEAIAGVDRVHDALIDQEGRLEGFSFEATAAGQTYPGLATPHAREEGRVMAWAIDTPEIEGVLRVELTDEGHGTRLAVALELESRTILSSMFFPVVATAIESGLPGALQRFASGFGGSDHSS